MNYAAIYYLSNFTIWHLDRASYASSALGTTNLPPEQATQMGATEGHL